MRDKPEETVCVPRAFLEFLRLAPVSSGVCMCGGSEAGHATEDHGYVDMWDCRLASWLDRIEQEAASANSPRV